MEEITLSQIIFLFFFSGFISIDRLAGLNIMLSRPIVVSGIIGIVFSDIYAALMIGLIFEFIGMLEVPVGTTITHDDTFGGYASSLAMVLGIVSPDAINILAAILITSLLMYPVTYSDKVLRDFIEGKPEEYLEKTDIKRIVIDYISGFTDNFFNKEYEIYT